jgi:hypothetical protein
MTDARERWCIVIEPQAGAVPAAQRIKRWLKAGLRFYGLRCVRLDEPAELVSPRRQNERLHAEKKKQST